MNDIQQSLPWLQSAWSQLVNYINQNRIPQALLIIGKKGIGKELLAENFAQSLMCNARLPNGNYCGECQSCRLYGAGTHPDFILIEPEESGKSIGISVIRQLITKLELKPQFESNRVVIINPADSLNNASANAFLKYLEEPTERTSLILITDRPSKLPATIRSRCQKIDLSVPGETVLKAWMEQQGVEENSELLMSLSQRAPLLAKQLADSSVLTLRTECFNNWLKFTGSEMSFIDLSEQWNKLDRTELNFLMFWLISWVVDMIKLAHQPQSIKIYNPDLATNLQDLVQGLDLKDLYKYYDFLLLSQQRLDTQLNKQLMVEEILILWSKLNSR